MAAGKGSSIIRLADLTGAMEEVLDHVEELGIGRGANILKPVGDLMVRVLAGYTGSG